jgi:formamidopyrimidine-DNA glycosylase
MPELPEVEVTRLSFASKITGARIASAQLGKPLRWPLGVPVQQLVGHYVVSVRRRGKYLLLDLDDGLLLIHLGMSGSLSFSDSLPPLGLHDHFELVTNQGTLRLHDPRRFGAVVFAPSEGSPVALKLLGKLGVEPLSEAFEPRTFHAGLKRRHAAIKQVLLAGDVVVGVGNIYACEVLFLAGIRPSLRADCLSFPRVVKLHAAIQSVLARAVDRGGSTLRDFSNASGETGHFQLETMVYGRADQPCQVCGNRVKIIRQGQRSTFFCRACQR